ncbi:MAG: tetratricopeptide repeat protein [Acidobacteriia bacterium]|nr:tetratricopeptide repeat protein [Terriglobia bacterium]
MHRCLVLFLAGVASLPGQVSPQTLIEKSHYKRARALAEERFRSDPKDPETLWLVSCVKQAWKDFGSAVDAAEKAVAADPKSSRYHLRLADALSDQAIRASKLRQLGFARRIKKEIETTLALDPRNVEGMKWLMQYDLQAPALFGGDKTKGRAMPDGIMQIDPVQGYFAQIEIARFDKQRERVEGLYRKAVEARPSSYEAQLALGNYCASQDTKKFDEAERHAREALRIDADRVTAHNLLAAVLVRQSKWTELDRALAEAERAIPDNLAPYYRAAANCVSMNHELPRAEQYIRKYLGQEPEPNMASHAEAHWRLGRTLEKQSRNPEAIAEYQATLRMDPDSPARQDLKRLK